MAATGLNAKRAIQMSVFAVRPFVRLREMLANNRQLAAKISELEDRLETHDSTIQDLIGAIKDRPAGNAAAQDRLPPAKPDSG